MEPIHQKSTRNPVNIKQLQSSPGIPASSNLVILAGLVGTIASEGSIASPEIALPRRYGYL